MDGFPAAAGHAPADGAAFVVDYSAGRYGIDGHALLRLQKVLSTELETALAEDLAKRPYLLLVSLRKAIFRGASPFAGIARPGPHPVNNHQQLWEPSPFWCWLFLRPILTPAVLSRLRNLVDEGQSIAARLRGEVRDHADDLESLFGLVEALAVMVEGLELLEVARAHYHAASLVQHGDPSAFSQHLAATCTQLDLLRPGLARVRAIVERMDRLYGFDCDERAWIAIHERSLGQHIDALRNRDSSGDSLLEFGEFLRRPAHIPQRLTWR